MDTYDEIPYDSTPVTETDPDRLAVIGRLFGLECAPPDSCRVLELGCAAGGNLIPLAWRNPRSSYLGVELSARQVADGRGLIERLGLDNIELRQADILELGDELGRFDYILCHGVFSWVPEAVRARILELGRELLNAQGLFYVSYNTLPGWRTRGMLRDMLLYHTRHARSSAERLAQADQFLDLILSATSGLDAASVRALRQQIERIREAHPSYLFHEYLEPFNEPMLFSDFMAQAEAKGLAYVADCALHSMFPSALGDEVEAAFGGINEAIEQEQYLDFVLNRNFRQTLLCRDQDLRGRELDLEQFESLAFYADLQPPAKVELRRPKAQQFKRHDGESLRVEHPLTKAALLYLGSRYPDAVAFDALAAVARETVAAQGGARHADESGHLFGELFSLFLHEAVGASTRAETYPQHGDRPKASALARAQAAAGLGHVATARHTTLSLDELAVHLMGLLDGTRTLDDLARSLTEAIGKDPRQLPQWRELSKDPRRLEHKVRQACARLLTLFARQGILVGGDRGAD